MIKLSSLLLIVFSLTFYIHSEENARPKSMTFSYVDHPTMTNTLIPLIRSTYDKLGIKTYFTPQPSNRNLRLLESNVIDGDVGYLKSSLVNYNNVTIIEPAVTKATYTLLCQPNILCSESILMDDNQILVSTAASQSGLTFGYNKPIKTRFYTINNISLIPEFILQQRFKYALYPTTEDELWRIQTPQFNYVKLHEFSLYHVINKKYEPLADEISHALNETILERKLKSNQD